MGEGKGRWGGEARKGVGKRTGTRKEEYDPPDNSPMLAGLAVLVHGASSYKHIHDI